MFGLVYAIIFTFGIFFQWSLWFMMGFTIAIVLLQYLLGPYIIRWVYAIEWIPYETFSIQYPHLVDIINKVVDSRGIKTPRIGIINDLNPNAFTFGHTKNNARIVITRGILHYLDEKEQQAVVAHELGHVIHSDFILMTIVFAIPLLLLTIVRWCYYSSRGFFRSQDEKGVGVAIGAALIAIAVLSYVAYFISYLVSLVISRIREYYADEHAGELIENPNYLSSALVKIAYGLIMEREVEDRRSSRTRALKGLGIFDPNIAAAFAVASTGAYGKLSKEAIQAAAAWDLFNPWAKYYQMFSTHPLPAKRIMRLNNQCEIYGIKPEIDFTYARKLKEEQAGKSMFPEFMTDLTIKFLPIIILIALIALTAVFIFGIETSLTNIYSNLLLFWAFGFFLIGFGVLIRIGFKYKSGFEPKTVLDLVTYIKASPIRTIPAILEGRIVGRGAPGYYFGEDMILQDNTGLIYLDYESLIPLFGNIIFAMRTIKKYIGQQVRVIGWYRRGPGPYIEIKSIESANGQRNKNYRKQVSYFWAIVAFIIGLFLFYYWYIASPNGFFGIF
ncbi:MAG TPA: zinc metalloprotease HtpX [Candidatus Lokiarchaeia archaeon]